MNFTLKCEYENGNNQLCHSGSNDNSATWVFYWFVRIVDSLASYTYEHFDHVTKVFITNEKEEKVFQYLENPVKCIDEVHEYLRQFDLDDKGISGVPLIKILQWMEKAKEKYKNNLVK